LNGRTEQHILTERGGTFQPTKHQQLGFFTENVGEKVPSLMGKTHHEILIKIAILVQNFPPRFRLGLFEISEISREIGVFNHPKMGLFYKC